jgi:hypothetical protein
VKPVTAKPDSKLEASSTIFAYFMSPPQDLKCALAYRVHVFPDKVGSTRVGLDHEEKSGISRDFEAQCLKTMLEIRVE